MKKAIIKKGEHKGKKAIIISIKNKIVTLKLNDVSENIVLNEEDIEPI